jgi:transcriptional regulator with XRE-family HTH domain
MANRWKLEGEMLRSVRLRLGLNQQEFAEELDISQQIVSLYEGGSRQIADHCLGQIADVFGVFITRQELGVGLSDENLRLICRIGRSRREERFDEAMEDTSTPLVQRLCRALDWSQNFLVDSTGVHRFTVSDVWNGKVDMKPKDAEKFAQAFGIDPTELLSGVLSEATVKGLRHRLCFGKVTPPLHKFLLTDEEAAVIMKMRQKT